MGNPGKNKLLRYVRVYAGSYDISGDVRTFSSLDFNCGEVDMTGVSDTSRHFLSDQIRAVGIRGLRVFGNDAASGAHTVLKTPADINFAVVMGGNAEPENSDPAYILNGVQITAPATFDGGAFVLDADVLAKGSYGNTPWGKILMPKTSLSTTQNGTSIDNGVATTSGYLAFLIVFATASGNFTFEVEHAVTEPTYSTLCTFTANGGSVTNEVQTSGSATVNRFVRFAATRVAGSATVFCGFVRF